MSTKENAIIEKVVMRPLADLVPNPKNPRTAQDEDIAALAESIKANPRFFVARPILLSDRTGVLMIIAGERRSEAAKLLGMTEVPTILLSGLTEAQEDEIMVRDNTHAGKWDEAKLRTWSKEQLKSWNVEDVKFEPLMGGIPGNLDAEPKNAPFVCKITFQDADSMTKFVNRYKNILQDEFGCSMSESGGEL